uniref:Uncharacterized protein n=1 Tax=Setaria viridis TaxID=4556 RepID=A0A4U6VLQ2_SETVI|nr:hypothetical protein SEVIR_3G403700v2 [Setaria viridis]
MDGYPLCVAWLSSRRQRAAGGPVPAHGRSERRDDRGTRRVGGGSLPLQRGDELLLAGPRRELRRAAPEPAGERGHALLHPHGVVLNLLCQGQNVGIRGLAARQRRVRLAGDVAQERRHGGVHGVLRRRHPPQLLLPYPARGGGEPLGVGALRGRGHGLPPQRRDEGLVLRPRTPREQRQGSLDVRRFPRQHLRRLQGHGLGALDPVPGLGVEVLGVLQQRRLGP